MLCDKRINCAVGSSITCREVPELGGKCSVIGNHWLIGFDSLASFVWRLFFGRLVDLLLVELLRFDLDGFGCLLLHARVDIVCSECEGRSEGQRQRDERDEGHAPLRAPLSVCDGRLQ